MKIVCPNCMYEFDNTDDSIYNIQLCPKCGAPYIRDGGAVTWAK